MNEENFDEVFIEYLLQVEIRDVSTKNLVISTKFQIFPGKF